MYDAELRRVNRILKFRDRVGLLKDKEVYLFGVSDNTRQIIRILRELHVEPEGVIDNDVKKQNSYCARLKVISFDAVPSPAAEEKLYIIYSAFWREMVPQLREAGIKRNGVWQLTPNHEKLGIRFYYACQGKLYRKDIRKRYGDVPIFVCPYTGTGDIYLIGTFWNEYIRRNGIGDYVFVVISGACKKVASLFDIKNVELTKNKKYAEYLIDYYKLDPEHGKIKILNDVLKIFSSLFSLRIFEKTFWRKQ